MVRALARRFKPWHLYKIKGTGQWAQIQAFATGGTLTVYAWHPGLPEAFGHGVFGIKPSDLERISERELEQHRKERLDQAQKMKEAKPNKWHIDPGAEPESGPIKVN